MNKQEFLARLRYGLAGLPQEDIEERITFYSEIIDDRMEEGLSEDVAVSEIGSVDEIVSQVVEDIPIARLVKEKITPKKRIKAWEIVLLVLGSPIWLSLAIAVFAVIFSLYVIFWSIVISLWAVFASFIGGAIGGIAAGIVFACTGHNLSGIAIIGAGIVCAGLSIFMFYVCKAATKGILIFSKKFLIWIKNFFVNKEEA